MPKITIDRENIEEAIQTIANAIGASQEKVREYIDSLIEYYQLLQSACDSFTLIYGEPAMYEETVMYKLQQIAEEFERMMERIDYVMEDLQMSFEAPFRQIHYTERLHPRKDGYVKPYWLRIRSNPYRRNYH